MTPSKLDLKKIPREELIRECWYRGRLRHLWHPAQKKIDEIWRTSPSQLIVLNIARQFGKSFYCVSKAIEFCMQKPNARVKYGTAFQTDLREFILPTFEKVLESCPADIRPKYKAHGSKWVFKNGAEIKLVGLDRSPNSLRGNVIDLIIIDEAGFVANLKYIYESIIMPATLHRPNCKILFVSTPPRTPAHPFTDFAQMAELTGSYMTSTIYDNPLITPDDIKRMADAVGGIHTTTFRREFLCEFITDEELQIIPEWKTDYEQEILRDQYFGYYHKYVGMDLGVKDLTALIFGYWDFKRACLIIEHEFDMSGPSMNTTNLVADIKAKETEIWGEHKPFRRIADNNWPILIQDLTTLHNLPFIATTKESLEAMINEVRILVQNGQIIVHPRCKKLIGCLRYGVWDEKKKQFARSMAYGHFDHLAALVYLIRYIAKNTNPIPVDYGHDNHRSWLGHVKNMQNNTHNARVVGNIFKGKKV